MPSSQSLIRRNWRTFIAIAAQGVDTLLIIACFLAANHIENPDRPLIDLTSGEAIVLGLTVVVFIVLLMAHGVYRMIAFASFTRQIFMAGRALIIVAAVVFSAHYIAGSSPYARRAVLLLFAFFAVSYPIVWILGRIVLARLREAGYGKWNTLVMSTGSALRTQVEWLRENPQLGYDVVRAVKFAPGPDRYGRHHVNLRAVEKAIAEEDVQVIIFTSPEINGTFDALESLCRTSRVRMLLLSPESDKLFRETPLHDLPGIPLFTPVRKKIEFLRRLSKRTFDLVLGTGLLVLFSPVFLLVAIATKIESPGPVFYRQRRSLSDHDKPFDFYKFRSMHHRAEEMRDELLHHNMADGALFKIRNDPRLTRVGRIIRRFSIDELPQLLNVLKGEMSLVGPRPLPVGDFRRLRRRDHMGGYFRHRADAKPGMTGLWQISGRSDLGFREMILLDLYYIDNQTILFDLEILAQTLPVVILGKGAY